MTSKLGEDAEIILCMSHHFLKAAVVVLTPRMGPDLFTSSHLKWCISHFSLEYKK